MEFLVLLLTGLGAAFVGELVFFRFLIRFLPAGGAVAALTPKGGDSFLA